MAPEGEDHVKAQASLGCNRNVIQTENYGFKVFAVPSALLNGFSGHFTVQSDTPGKAGGLMSGAASKAVGP